MNLERAIEIAVAAHKGASDKGGQPYILHPLRLMMAMPDDAHKTVAVLHDVVEDSDWTFEALADEGFTPEIIAALQSVTRTNRYEPYMDFAARAKADPIGRVVKIADITDNLDVTRIGELSDKDLARINKYKRALALLRAP
ncbi:MAG: GTP pyrophosphokinase [Pseudomonadota bacterium]